ncbi:hypothetical protein KVT40_009400 [Elsinoe batatas]|uniref:Uncharacterized protein n=1 Tax=Elsinoe batatas TaxID=2601811 RepID=A0A8K0PET8_9PEZI|nr:hypothetical protein KVT40_009400 [Elsinoe batatas]
MASSVPDVDSSQAALRLVLAELEERKEKKRRQNRMAQRTYRHNQKQRMLALQAAVCVNEPGQDVPALSVDNTSLSISAPVMFSPAMTSSSATARVSAIEPVQHYTNGSPQSSNSSAATTAGFFSPQTTPVIEEAAWTFSPLLDHRGLPSTSSLPSQSALATLPATGQTVLHLSVQESSYAMMRLLLNHGAEVNKQDSHGITPLHMAAHNGNTEAITTLLEHTADPNIADWSGRTPLLVAVKQGHRIAVTLLLKAAADIHWKDNSGHSALHVAVQVGSEKIVSILLSHGADINA